jgi:hypothetical protein
MKTICFILLLAIAGSNGYGQRLTFKQRTQITAGLSTTDAANLGARYRIKQSQLWCNIGLSAIGRNNHFITVGPAFSQHLWGTSKKTDLKPWYLKLAMTGVDYSLQTTRIFAERAQILYAKVHLGRDFNITQRAGVTFSIGPSARIFHKWNRPDDQPRTIDLINFASFDLNIYYRLQKIS